jgi:hypothetical protein
VPNGTGDFCIGRRKVMKRAPLILLLILLSACYTARSNLNKSSWREQPLVFNRPYEQVWDACIQSLQNGKYTIIVQDHEKGRVVGMRPGTPLRIGGTLEIEVKSLGEKATWIDFVSKGASRGFDFDTGGTNASFYLRGVRKLLGE